MAIINQFSLYSMGSDFNNIPKDDKVDGLIKELINIDEYEDVCNFVKERFGDIQGNKMFEYPDVKKQINVFVERNRVEICAAKEYKQFWSKGWLDGSDKD